MHDKKHGGSDDMRYFRITQMYLNQPGFLPGTQVHDASHRALTGSSRRNSDFLLSGALFGPPGIYVYLGATGTKQ